MRDISAWPYAGSAINLFAYAFFLGAAATLLSSADRYRARTIGLMATFYIVSLILKVAGRISDSYEWLLYGSFLSAYEPEKFVESHGQTLTLAIKYDLPLIAAGVLCYLLAAVIFSRRDIPAPL